MTKQQTYGVTLRNDPQVERLKRLGIEPGKPFNTSKASPDVRAALARAPKPALAEMKRRLPTIAPVVNGWLMNTETMGVYGNGEKQIPARWQSTRVCCPGCNASSTGHIAAASHAGQI